MTRVNLSLALAIVSLAATGCQRTPMPLAPPATIRTVEVLVAQRNIPEYSRLTDETAFRREARPSNQVPPDAITDFEKCFGRATRGMASGAVLTEKTLIPVAKHGPFMGLITEDRVPSFNVTGVEVLFPTFVLPLAGNPAYPGVTPVQLPVQAVLRLTQNVDLICPDENPPYTPRVIATDILYFGLVDRVAEESRRLVPNPRVHLLLTEEEREIVLPYRNNPRLYLRLSEKRGWPYTSESR